MLILFSSDQDRVSVLSSEVEGSLQLWWRKMSADTTNLDTVSLETNVSEYMKTSYVKM